MAQYVVPTVTEGLIEICKGAGRVARIRGRFEWPFREQFSGCTRFGDVQPGNY